MSNRGLLDVGGSSLASYEEILELLQVSCLYYRFSTGIYSVTT
jgi:hypothetical protein